MRPWRAESTEGRKGAPSERLLAVLNALQTGGKRKHGTNVTSSSIRTGSIRALLKYTRNIEHMNVIISSTHPQSYGVDVAILVLAVCLSYHYEYYLLRILLSRLTKITRIILRMADALRA